MAQFDRPYMTCY